MDSKIITSVKFMVIENYPIYSTYEEPHIQRKANGMVMISLPYIL